jgi:tRNA nucleotidyltransferase (CCA-adding enzyme)
MKLSLVNFLHPQQWQIVQKAAMIAGQCNLRLFAVGGIVRDALLADQTFINICPPDIYHFHGSNFISDSINNFDRIDTELMNQTQINDIDLVVDGAPKAGIILATALHKYYSQARLQVHDKFQTAELYFASHSLNLDRTNSEQIDWAFTIDLATAREEIYAYQGANPEVKNTTIDHDLLRRDFTINALAIEILPSGIATEIIDQFNGLADLKHGLLRPIRTGSFAEDPRRIYRAVRFAVRLNLNLSSAMVDEIKNTVSTGQFNNLGGSRLRAEIIYNLQEKPITKSWRIWQKLADLGALRCIHPELKLAPDFAKHLRRLAWITKQVNQLDNSQKLVKTGSTNFAELGLGLLCSYLSVDAFSQLNLALTAEQEKINLLSGKYQKIQANLSAYLLANQLTNLTEIKPSFLCEQFSQCHEWELMLLFCQTTKPMRKLIWCYINQWQFVKSPLNGKDLQQLGFPSGKILGKILAQLRNLYLDGVIDSPQSARAWIMQNQVLLQSQT